MTGADIFELLFPPLPKAASKSAKIYSLLKSLAIVRSFSTLTAPPISAEMEWASGGEKKGVETIVEVGDGEEEGAREAERI